MRTLTYLLLLKVHLCGLQYSYSMSLFSLFGIIVFCFHSVCLSVCLFACVLRVGSVYVKLRWRLAAEHGPCSGDKKNLPVIIIQQLILWPPNVVQDREVDEQECIAIHTCVYTVVTETTVKLMSIRRQRIMLQFLVILF